MSIRNSNRSDEIELITEAMQSNDPMRLRKLSNSVYMNVRKAVAKNRSIDSTLINKMAETEKASSVLYWVLKNPSCNSTKELAKEDLLNPCVTCTVSELNLYSACISCKE